MNEIPFYTAANLTRDPELRNTAEGKSVARLSLAVTPRRREQGGAWVDGTTTFLDATVWGDQAENVALSLHKGDRVIVTPGRDPALHAEPGRQRRQGSPQAWGRR